MNSTLIEELGFRAFQAMYQESIGLILGRYYSKARVAIKRRARLAGGK